MGIQDFNSEVQAAIGRHQDEAATRTLFTYCREKGFTSINLDLIYGLPCQTPDRFAHTLATALLLRPDRVALYSYAHIPWAKGHQKRIDVEAMPTPDQKLDLFLQALRAFGTSGYASIGMDHFSLPDDELNLASDQGRLFRNFMGYTARHIPNQIGVGVSAIGEVFSSYIQNTKKLKDYYDALDAGVLPVERGYIMSRDDQVRRYVIQALMCNFQLNYGVFQSAFNLRFADYFAKELKVLEAGPQADGLVTLTPDGIEVTASGRLLIRVICMCFDRYLTEDKTAQPRFSRTV
jgi:oxygen-independent coproporphyrinogen-3 oxidase